ncbi:MULTISPECIES: DUF262 domain-containing protein [unclassified Sphingopyxis]|uniref:DUF262 domain-containing protein n=1 Tax=unclassified Sphingopyxis TaxID=2614943 RepID=UPI00072FB3E7|nr:MULTISPECIES: DUF262 domain-containing protein [unclassified Sphingopyxis]KTE26609.1 hypothetical protein ATE61_07780 [Sphingopyxis sp. H057]KTE53015.1 hypothetical protein ATE64_10225 [Sphingopyxis sp. H073]KTE55205.1 hypothetical protein ATE69_10200 [Sphingopyxis sp. H071]KTE58694.1 hypothetical protein ATE66_14030 [Sphingopyxis sp. H107]KTE61291.1 hypothetical protein ATE65_18030 [Sphingopyxis sp. H100]
MAKVFDDEIEVEEESDDEELGTHIEFDIATYPSDLTLAVIHDMWRDKDITVPSFQRNFVWNIKQSSLLIESFLLGLPVPQVFFYIDGENKNLVIDGQQRIMSVIYFFEGYFGPENMQGRRSVFRLTGLSKGSPYSGKKFVDLTEQEQRKLKSAVLRAVNIKQLAPVNQSTSMFHIFERLNTGGTPLRPQEIRNCVFHGALVDELHDLNEDPNWRKILSRQPLDKHQRDVEMILRIFAMTERGDDYEKPMKEFLNQQMKIHTKGKNSGKIDKFGERFREVTELIVGQLDPKPFHVRGPLNLAAMDSVMATLIRHSNKIPKDLKQRFTKLIADKDYRNAIFFNTSDPKEVELRLALAEKHLIY